MNHKMKENFESPGRAQLRRRQIQQRNAVC